jgi:hypothetical protein
MANFNLNNLFLSVKFGFGFLLLGQSKQQYLPNKVLRQKLSLTCFTANKLFEKMYF